MKIYWKPNSPPQEGVPLERLALLTDYWKQGFTHFFVRASPENLPWAIAGLYSPLVLVPLSPYLSREAEEASVASLGVRSLWYHSLGPISGRESWASAPLGKSFGEIWALVQTSGSSRGPRWLAHSGDSFRAAALGHQAFWGSDGAAGPWLLALPWNHVGGLSVILRALFLDGAIAVAGEGVSWMDWLRWDLLKSASLVPTQVQKLVETDNLSPPKSLKRVLVGGAGLPEATRMAGLSKGWPLHRTYGLTEAASQVASEKNPGEGLLPLAHWEVKVVEREILIRGRALFAGVWREGMLSPPPLENGWYATGDQGALSARGGLEVWGRQENEINSGGYKINAEYLEGLIGSSGAIAGPSLVFGMEHEIFGQEVVLVTNAPLSREDWRSLLDLLKSKVDRRALPRKCFYLPNWPLSDLGKPKRRELRERIKGLSPLFEKA